MLKKNCFHLFFQLSMNYTHIMLGNVWLVICSPSFKIFCDYLEIHCMLLSFRRIFHSNPKFSLFSQWVSYMIMINRKCLSHWRLVRLLAFFLISFNDHLMLCIYFPKALVNQKFNKDTPWMHNHIKISCSLIIYKKSPSEWEITFIHSHIPITKKGVW